MSDHRTSLSPPQAFDFALGADHEASSPSSHYTSPSASSRLDTIDESTRSPLVPPIPARSLLRQGSNSSLGIPSQSQVPPSFGLPPGPLSPKGSTRASKTSSDTNATRTAPPAYSWMPDVVRLPLGSNRPVEGEKLAALRRRDQTTPRHRQRGGWKRLGLIVAVVALVVIGLAVGLGVGLTVGREHNDNNSSSSSSSSSNGSGSSNNSSSSSSGSQPFPLGTYSMVTALYNQQSACSYDSNAWSCYPYSVYNPSDSSSSNTSLATFNWIISSTSSNYATVNTGATSSSGIPANLTISSTNNPFSISFSNISLTYLASSSNSSSARYTFSLPLSKFTIPSTALPGTDGSTRSECFFNSTTLTGTLYLSAARNFPSSASQAASADIGGYPQWPFAVEVTQSSPGGANTPACYALNNGVLGQRITSGFVAQGVDQTCLCDYRNFV